MTPALILHVGTGAIAILSGAAALAFRKGERLHRAFGTVFFISMLTTAALAAYLAVIVPQRIFAVAGVLAFYLVATAWVTIRRREGSVGLFEIGALPVALGVAAAGLTFGLRGANSPTGLLDGAPHQAAYAFAAVAALAAASDLRMILRRGVSGAPRIARHLWRMCFALFLAAGAFFFGQSQLFPASVRPFLFVPVIAPFILMLFWLIRVRLTNWYKHDASVRGNT